MRTRIAAPPGRQPWTVERVTWLTPYTADEIAQQARRAGPGACLEVVVPKNTSTDSLAAVDSLFAWLREKGIEVVVRRDEQDA